MRLVLIFLVLLPLLLSLAESAPSMKPKTNVKKGKQLVYFSPQPRMGADVDDPAQHVRDADDEEDAEDEDGDDDDADDDADDDDDDAFDIPDFNEVFPNPDGRPVGPNSYDAYLKHSPNAQSQGGPGGHGGPAANGQSGPRVQGQAGPRVAGQSGPRGGGHSGPVRTGHPGGGQRRGGPYGRIDIEHDSQEIQPFNYGLPPGAQIVQYVPNSDSYEETENFYPKRDGRQNYASRNQVVYRPIGNNYNYNRRQYVPYRRPTSGVFYTNRPQVNSMYYPSTATRIQTARPVYNYGVSPIRRNNVVVPTQTMYRRPTYGAVQQRPTYVMAAPPTRIGQARGIYNPWSYSPLRGDNYNPEYVVNPTEMLSRRRFRYHPSQSIPSQRIPLVSSGTWGNPRYIQRDPWTGAHYHGGYLSSQI